MKFKPHDYQCHTIQFIEDHPEAAILLGMGMGKSVSTLTAIDRMIHDSFTVHRVLVIAPLRVARDTWPAEIAKWDHLKHLRVSVMVGPKATREAAAEADADIYVINRENIPWLVTHFGSSWPFDMVVIDELSSFKSHQAQRFKALRKVRPKIRRMVGLTGTPAPNSLLDLWAPFRLLDDGQRLGKHITHYRGRYFLPDKRDGMRIFTWKLRPGADEEIYHQIADVALSMETTDYLDLPPMTTSTQTVEMTSAEAKTYRTLREDMVATIDGQTIDAGSAAVLSGKLQQLASGAIYDEDGRVLEVHSRKVDALADIVESLNGQTVLVACWFKHERQRVLDAIPGARELSTAQDMADWCAGRIPVGLIHPASAGHGLNLQSGGHNLVWLTTPWSLELYEQTNARLFRQGQEHPVSVVHLACADTVDEQVLAALERKDVGQSALKAAVAAHVPEAQVAA